MLALWRISAIAAAIIFGFAPAAFAQKSKPLLTTEITTCFPDNVVGAITPAIMRTCTGDFLNSWQQYAAVNAQVGTSYTVQTSDYGQLITFNNASPIAVSLPQAVGSFATFSVYAVNLGAGIATITPTISTINGASSFALGPSQSVFIVSDGTNYQVWKGAVGSINTGTGGQLGWYASTGTAISGNANATISNGTLTLGQTASVFGAVVLNNAAGGTLTVTPQTAALGTSTATLASGTYNIVGDNLTQTLTSKTINCSSNTCTVPLASLATGSLDQVIGYFGATTGNAIGINNCANALTYSTSTHTFGCNVSGGTGTVTTPGSGLVSSTTAACSQAANQSTLSAAECVNAQSGTSYAIQDGDRAKLITTSNISPQTYTIAQAGAASNFQAGWFADLQNIGTGTATISPTTSTINGQTQIGLGPGAFGRLVSDGSNYRFLNPSEGPLEILSPSGVSSIPTSASWVGCSAIEFQISNLVFSSAGQNLQFQVNSSGVQATSYLNSVFSSAAGGALAFATPTTFIQLNGGNSIGSGTPGLTGIYRLANVNSSSNVKQLSGTAIYVSNGATTATSAVVGGWWNGGNGTVSGGLFSVPAGGMTGTIKEFCIN